MRKAERELRRIAAEVAAERGAAVVDVGYTGSQHLRVVFRKRTGGTWTLIASSSASDHRTMLNAMSHIRRGLQ